MEKKYLETSCDFIDGVKVRAMWDCYKDEDSCLLVKSGSTWYLLQDRHDGSRPSPNMMKNYRYGWSLSDSWSRGQANVLYIYLDEENNSLPLTMKIASDSWDKFEATLKKVKDYGKVLPNVKDIEELIGKLEKIVK